MNSIIYTYAGDGAWNIPYLAYRELCADGSPLLVEVPELQSKAWVDFWKCLGTFWRLRKAGRESWFNFLKVLARSRSFAVWDSRDPAPAFRHTVNMIMEHIGGLFKKT